MRMQTGNADETRLAERQIAMARALSAARAAWPEDVLGGVVPGGTLDAAGALDVYRNGYFARLTEQLGETYATVWRVLGDETFFAIATEYIAAHPSSSYNLSDYGRELPAFLASMPDVPAPFLAELAAFELAFHDLFHAPSHRAMPPSEMAALGELSDDLAGVRFRFGSAVRLFAYRHAVFDLFRHRDDAEAPDVEIERPQQLLMFKSDSDVRTIEIDAAMHVALASLAAGDTVDDALSSAVECDASFGPESVTRLFELIARCGLVTGWHR